MNTNHGFSPKQVGELRAHGIELFAGRVIFDAQPPMDENTIHAVQAQCSGPLPPDLLALWRQTAGGRLAYDLELEVHTSEGQRIEAISWAELFYEDSGHYNSLQGWIEHELERAEEAAEQAGRPFSGKLDYLPFGGFEYCDRIYVATNPAAQDHGCVLAWKMGLPPAWAPALTEDAVATFASDLSAAFSTLALHADPLDPDSDQLDLLEYLDVRCDDHGLARSLADAVVAFYRQAWIDWRNFLSTGILAAHPYALRLALRHAVENDDTELLRRIQESGADLDGVVIGNENALQYARFLKRSDVATMLQRLMRS